MLPSEMDEILGRHFAAEAAHDLDAALDTLTGDVVHDFVGDPLGELRGHEAVKQRYAQLFADFSDERVTPIRRMYGENFLVDESMVSARAVGSPLGVPGHGRPVTFRLMHVCEFADGRISREQAWLDVAALMRQLTDADAQAVPAAP
ncbi:ester cyclase [Pseudonocardia acaciae]|uniref:ester cyclase n=1 Tax=Pseudonocardia acaciae TaxID=551276 RepID=UPI000490E3FA|nr:ester cyclase [Pseudonocardia acaciae]